MAEMIGGAVGSRDLNTTEAAARDLTEILEQHRFHYDLTKSRHACTCGDWCDSGPGENRVVHNHSEHVAEVAVAVFKVTSTGRPPPPPVDWETKVVDRFSMWQEIKNVIRVVVTGRAGDL